MKWGTRQAEWGRLGRQNGRLGGQNGRLGGQNRRLGGQNVGYLLGGFPRFSHLCIPSFDTNDKWTGREVRPISGMYTPRT